MLFRSRSLVHGAVAAAALLLAGCGDLPRPFQPDEKREGNQLLVLPDRAGVFVQPVAGLPDPEAARLAEHLAEALRRENVPASTRSRNAASFVLHGDLLDGSRVRLVLRAPSSDVVGTHELARAASADANDRIPPEIQDTAALFARALQPDAVAVAAAPPARRAVRIGTINGTPEGGDIALSRALDYALRRFGITPVDASVTDSLVVNGTVAITPKGAQLRAVDVRWTVLAPDGTEIGQVNQQNDVPAAYLERAWAELAVAVAEGAAEGIVELVEQAAPPVPSAR